MSNMPALLSRTMVLQALGDPSFFRALPEFAGLQPKLRTMGVDLQRRGCKGCRQRRVEQNVFRDFLHILQTLDAEALARLKQFFGVSALMITTRDAKTGAFAPQTL